MKKILAILIMFFCITSCVVLINIGCYADGATIWIVDPQPKFSTTKDGTYYSSKEDLLDNTPEKTLVDKVYVKMNLKVGANSPNTDAKIKSVTVLGSTTTFTPNEKVEVKFGPMGKSSTNKTITVNYTYKYKDSKGKEQTGNGSSSFNTGVADGFDSTTYGKLGTNPTGEIHFYLGGSTVDTGETSATKPLYRYKQTVSLVVNVADNGSSSDGQDHNRGVKSFSISGDLSINKSYNSPVSETKYTHSTNIATSETKYEDIADYTYSGTVVDGVGKEGSIPSVKLSDQILKHHKIDAEIIPTGVFDTYVDGDEVVIEFKITYGQEFLRGISNIQATTSEVYVPVDDSDRVKVVEDGEGNYNRVYKVRTKKKPTDKTQSVFLHYETNAGGDGYTELAYTLSNELAAGYEYTDSTDEFLGSNKIQKFDITNGNLWVDENNIAHYGKVISGLTGETNDETESTVTCYDIIMITGTTDKYIVKIDKGGKKIIFDKNLSITSSETHPIILKGGTADNNDESTSVVILGGGQIKTSAEGKSGIYIQGGVANFYSGPGVSFNKHFKIESEKGAGISVSDGGNINIKQVCNFEIIANNGGAGIGTEANGVGGEIYVMNSPITVTATGGGAAIGTGKGGTLSKVKVEGVLRNFAGEYYGNNYGITLTVDSGACIGAGSNGTISGEVEVNNLSGPLRTGANGVVIGASSGGKCGSVTANRLRIAVGSNTSGAGVAIGAGTGATCGDILVKSGNIDIYDCTVGVGADSNATCGNITIDTEAELKVRKGEVGVGARDNASMGNIKITSLKSFSQVDLKTTKVGIGSLSNKTGNSNIEITCPNGNYTSSTTVQAEVVINGSEVCVGAADNGKIKNITVTNCNKVLLTPSTTGVGIGANGSSEAGNINLSTSNIRVDSCSIGIGGSGTVRDINVNSCGNVVVKSSKVGIGSSTKVGNIAVTYSSFQIGDSSNKSEIGIGVSADANMGNITVSDRNNVKIYASNIGIGSGSNKTGSSSINIVKGKSTHKGGSNIEIIGVSGVGIGTTGVIGFIDVRGNSGITKVSKITIKGSSDSEGVGIGASGTCGNIVVAANVQIGESGTKFKIGIGGSGTCGDIEVREGNNVVNNVVIYASNVGIGFDGSTATSGSAIEIRNIKLDISGCAVGIGATSGAKAGDIDISTCPVVDDEEVDISLCGIKIVPTTTGIGIGGSGTCGDIKCTGIPVGIGSNDISCSVGIGTLAGSIGDIEISSCGVKIYATDIGVGSGTSNTSEKKVSISGSELDVTGSNVGIGTKGSLSIITMQSSSSVITPKSDGLGIGALGSDATVGDITLNNTSVKVNNCAIGIGTSGTCGKIKIINCENIILKSNTVGIGGTRSTGAIIVEGSNFEIGDSSRKSTVGVGTNSSTGEMGDILIGWSSMNIDANDVGIGSNSTKTGTNMSGIITYITGSTLNISGATVGVGAYNGNIGPIMIGSIALEDTGTSEAFESSGTEDSTKIKVVGQGKGTGVGIGSAGGFCVNICLDEAKVDIGSISIGVGTDNQIGLIKISNDSNILINGNNVGIGVTGSNASTNLYVENSDVEIKDSTKVGIGTTENGELNNISFNNSNIKVAMGTNGVGVGGLGEVSGITLENSTQADIGGGIVGIGVSGSSGKCESISIVGCPSVLAYGSGVCIGNNGLAFGSGECIIVIGTSKVKVAGDGVGVGGATNGVGEIEISGGSTVVANTGSTGVGGSLGACGDINISGSGVRVSSTNGGAGIGGLGIVGAITVSSSTVDVSAKSSGSGIGGGSYSIGDIAIYESNVKTSSQDGMGIGGNSFSSGSSSRIDVQDSELDIATTGDGTGIGTILGTLGNISIKNSGVKINGGSGTGVGIGASTGKISGIDLTNNIVSIVKLSGATGAGIGSGANGNVGNIELTKNKIVVSTYSGAGIGSGAGGEVTGTITIADGVIIGKSTNGACIGAGYGGSVKYIAIEDGKINANVAGDGACIGVGSRGSVETLRIDKGEFVCSASSTGKGISASKLIIKDGDISVSSGNGNAVDATTLAIENGKVDIVSSGADGIKGTSKVEITGGVVKTKGSSNRYDVEGDNIVIARTANVQAYNNRTTGVTRGGNAVVQKKLRTDLWRNYEGVVRWSDGIISGEIKTDSSGDVYFWYNENEDKDMIFDMDGKRMVI